MNYWLFKSEPGTFGIDHLAESKRKTSSWNGVRNFQARNYMRDSMHKGDQGFFYHSGVAVPGIAGIFSVSRAAYADPTAFDPKDDHYDPDSDPAAPRWLMVDVTLVRKLDRLITLGQLRQHAKGRLKDMLLLRKGNRLSITPLAKSEWDFILSLE